MRIGYSTTKLGTAVLIAAVAAVAGCTTYEDRRPPVGQLDKRDRDLQSKDVVQASDEMAESLLGAPGLNASQGQWIMVVDRVEDNTTGGGGQNFDVFLRRLRNNLHQMGKGRVTLIENRAQLQALQDRERDSGGPAAGERDDFGQGGDAPAMRLPPGRLQPDYALYARITDLPNRGTNYYFMEFTVTDLQNGTQPWADAYEVRVAR